MKNFLYVVEKYMQNYKYHTEDIGGTYVKKSICSIAHLHTWRQFDPVGHLNPTVCFFCEFQTIIKRYISS